MFLKQPITAVLSGSITWRLRGLNKPPFVNKAPLIRALQKPLDHRAMPCMINILQTETIYPPRLNIPLLCVCVCAHATIHVAIVPVLSHDLSLPMYILITFPKNTPTVRLCAYEAEQCFAGMCACVFVYVWTVIGTGRNRNHALWLKWP